MRIGSDELVLQGYSEWKTNDAGTVSQSSSLEPGVDIYDID